MVNIIKSEILKSISNYDVFAFGMGVNNSFNGGLLYEISINFPMVRTIENRISPYGDKRKYGTILPIIDSGITFCPCYVNNGGYTKKSPNEAFVKYDDLKRCLELIRERFRGKKICSTVIGASGYDGNGDKKKILSIFNEVFAESDIDVYDYEQKDFRLEMFRQKNENYFKFKRGDISKSEYEYNLRLISWKSKNGIFKPMPIDYVVDQIKRPMSIKKEDLEKNN